MTLLAVRQAFRQATGRLDLAPLDDSDSGADQFINRGIRLLDRWQPTVKSEARFTFDLTVGSYRQNFEQCLGINEVWIVNADSRTQLLKQSLGWIRANFDSPFSSVEVGTPAHYSEIPIGLSPEQESDTAGNVTYDDGDITYGDHYSKRGIIIMPRTDQLYTVNVVGFFGSFVLSADADQNYWTEEHEDLVVFAAAYILERFYRNSEGANDWLSALRDGLGGIDNALVNDEIFGVDQIGKGL